jgi:hypothetical protein
MRDFREAARASTRFSKTLAWVAEDVERRRRLPEQ